MKIYNSFFQIIEGVSYDLLSSCDALITRIQGLLRAVIVNLKKTHFITNFKPYKVIKGSPNPVIANIARGHGITPICLKEAVKTKNLETVKKVLEDKIKIKQEEFEFAIIEAVENGLEGIVQILDECSSFSKPFVLYLIFLAQTKGFLKISTFFEKEISLAASPDLEIKQALEYAVKKQELSFIESFASISNLMADHLIEICVEKGYLDIAEALIQKHKITAESTFYYIVILAKTRGYVPLLQLIIETHDYKVSELAKRIDTASLEKILFLADLDLIKYLIVKKKFSYGDFLRLALGMEKKDIVLFLLHEQEIQQYAPLSSTVVLDGDPPFTLNDLEFLAIVFAAENHNQLFFNELIEKEVPIHTLLLAQQWALIKGNIDLVKHLTKKIFTNNASFIFKDLGSTIALATALPHIKLLHHLLEIIPILEQAEIRFTIVRALILMGQKDKIVFFFKDTFKDFSDDIFIKAVCNNDPSVVEVILKKTTLSDLIKKQAFEIARDEAFIEIEALLEKEWTKI